MNRPNTCVNLIKAINRVAGPGRDALRLSRALANVIVAQMLPDGVVKGGSALMFRYGGNATRYTRDVDTARVMSLDAYLDKLEASLKTGWNGFTGRLQHVEPPHPEGIPQGYVMIPYDTPTTTALGRPLELKSDITRLATQTKPNWRMRLIRRRSLNSLVSPVRDPSR